MLTSITLTRAYIQVTPWEDVSLIDTMQCLKKSRAISARLLGRDWRAARVVEGEPLHLVQRVAHIGRVMPAGHRAHVVAHSVQLVPEGARARGE
eukprot:6194867-Pleurochrysis_carterae.AAC.1